MHSEPCIPPGHPDLSCDQKHVYIVKGRGSVQFMNRYGLGVGICTVSEIFSLFMK